MFNELADIHRHRSLLINLVRKDLTSRYRNSLLGWVWSMLHPLLIFLIIYLIFSAFFAQTLDHYGSYVITGVLVFHLFSACTTRCARVYLESAAIIRRSKLPLTIFPYATVLGAMVHFLFAAIPALLIILAFGAGPSTNIWLLPLAIAMTVLLLASIGVCLAIGSVYFQDLLHAYDVLLLVLMYASAIFYPLEIVPNTLHWIFHINPLFHLIEMYRGLFLVDYHGVFASMMSVLVSSVIFLMIANTLYLRRRQHLVYLV